SIRGRGEAALRPTARGPRTGFRVAAESPSRLGRGPGRLHGWRRAGGGGSPTGTYGKGSVSRETPARRVGALAPMPAPAAGRAPLRAGASAHRLELAPNARGDRQAAGQPGRLDPEQVDQPGNAVRRRAIDPEIRGRRAR